MYIRVAKCTSLQSGHEPYLFIRLFRVVDALDRLRSLCSLGVFHTQFNVIDTETLKEAQKHPEDYNGLLVRVAGYTAYFTELGKEVQDDIISRTSHSNIC